MSDPEIQFEDPAVAPADGTSQSSGKSTDASTRQLTVSVLLGLLAGEGDHPREGERDIVASAIRRALELSSQREFPSLARLIAAEGREEIDQRAARCRHNDMSMWGNYQDAPVLALCVEIHRNGFVDADGKEARCKLFLALVDLASSCTDLLASKSFKSAATGLRLLLGRLSSSPKGGSTTHHFSVWQTFDWVEKHPDLAEYVKNAIRALRPKFMLAWRASDSGDNNVEDEDNIEEACHEASTLNEDFWLLPELTRYECELPDVLEKKRLSSEITRITALSRYASSSLLNRSDCEMKSVVSRMLDVAKGKTFEAPYALAQLISIATGITIDHAYQIKCSNSGNYGLGPVYPGIVTIDGGWLVRNEFDPRTKQNDGFMPRTVHLPIPEPIAVLLREQPNGLQPGQAAIHIPVGVTKPKSPRAESEWFTTLVSRLIRDARYGVSLAQHALHTSLGLDTAPLYYDRIPASYVAHAMARITHPWFECPPRPRSSGMPTHSIGSQRVIEKSACRDFFGSLRAEWSNQLPLFRRIHLRSRNLRNGLLFGIASRTNNSIERILLGDFACNQLIMTVSDKAVALDHVSRLAALSPKLVQELKEYLAELHQVMQEYPGTPLASCAAEAIQGNGPLFLKVDAVDSCRALEMEDHLAELPSWAADINNWTRQLANDCLAVRLSEPLRVAQMGWHGARAGAISELSSRAPVGVLGQVSKAVEEMLKEFGWAPLPSSGLKPCPELVAPVHWMRANVDHEHKFKTGLRELELSAQVTCREFAGEVISGVNAFFYANKIALEATIDGVALRDGTKCVPVGREMHAALLRVMASSSQSEILARELIHNWMKKARREKIITGPLPKRVVRVRPNKSGPFVVQAHRSLDHRDAVLQKAQQFSLSLAGRTFLTVLLEGWVPDAGVILDLMQPGATLYDLDNVKVLLIEAASSKSEQGTVSNAGCLAFDGAAAMALRAWHRSGKVKSPDVSIIQAEIHAAISSVISTEVTDKSVIKELESLMRMNLGLRSPGIVRDVVMRWITPAFAPLARVVALHENHPIWPKSMPARAHLPERIEQGLHKARKQKSEHEYAKVKEVIADLVNHWTPGTDDLVRSQAVVALRLMVPSGVPRTGVHILALYASAYLAEGIKKEKVRPISVQNAIYSVGQALISALPEQADLSRRDVWEVTYARALDACKEVDRLRLAKDLSHFQKVMSREHDLPIVGMVEMLEALNMPSPPEAVGFLTHGEQAAVVFLWKLRVEARALVAAPKDLLETLCGQAIVAWAFSTSMRDREVRVPQIRSWRPEKSAPACIELRSNGQDFVKSMAGRRALRPIGPFSMFAIEATERLVKLKAAIRGCVRAEKLFAPNPMSVDANEIPDLMHQINTDLRYVTGSSQAAIDVTRKTWALSMYRSLDCCTDSLWPTRDMLGEMGQVTISTMLGYYLHDPMAFLERFSKGKEVSTPFAAWILGISPKSAKRLFGWEKSWLLPGAQSAFTSASGAFEIRIDGANNTFEPLLTEVNALMGLIAVGQTAASAANILGWPKVMTKKIESALNTLRERGVVVGHESTTDLYVMTAPARAHGHGALDDCRRDAHCWEALAWMFDQWLSDWRMWSRNGITAKPADWEKHVDETSPIRRLPWSHSSVGYMTFYQLPGERKNGHSAWSAIRWLALSAWILKKIRN